MPFLFSYPAAAWLFPAVALPIIFHLFFRLRRQVREFPSLMFFLRIDPRLSAKRKLHEWLILFLRCLFIALLIFALVRPLLGLKGGGGSIARLVLIDNSGSMSGIAAGGGSKMALAERATQKLISSLAPGDAVAVQLMVPDSTAALPSGFDAAPGALHDAVGKLTPSDGAASMPKAIRLALATLSTAKAARHELVILTDLQRQNWSRGDLAPEAQANPSHVVVRRIASALPTSGSVSLRQLDPLKRAIPVGRILALRVALENNGPAAAQVRLNSTDDSGKNVSHEFTVPPNGSAPATLTFSFSNPGFHWAGAWVEGDVSPTATRLDLGFWCNDVQKVVFVGTKDDFAALPYAVSPGGNANLSGIDGVFVGPDQLSESLAAKPLAVAVTWNDFPTGASSALEAYVRQGGTLLLVPKPGGGAMPEPPAWIDASLGATPVTSNAEAVMLLQEGDSLWDDLRDASGRPQLGTLRAFQYLPMKTGHDWRVVMASARGATLMASRALDHGHIVASGAAFSPKWSSLPLKASFVVLVQNAIFGDRAEPIPVQQIAADEDFEFHSPGQSASVKSLAGSALTWQGRTRDFPGFPHTGVYEIRQGEHVEWVTTSGNADEAKPDFFPLGPVPLLRNLPHDVAALTTENDLTQPELTSASAESFYRWLMLAALIVLLMETWLAHERSSDLGADLFKSREKRAAKKAQVSRA